MSTHSALTTSGLKSLVRTDAFGGGFGLAATSETPVRMYGRVNPTQHAPYSSSICESKPIFFTFTKLSSSLDRRMSSSHSSSGPSRSASSAAQSSPVLPSPRRRRAHGRGLVGLPDVPADIPVYAGPGEEQAHSMNGRLMYPTFARGLGERPLTLWPFEDAPALGPIDHAVDIFGDGSVYALSVPGHTEGSTAYLARTVDGPVLFTGDCSHTRWGWDNGVTPGTYTEDHDANRESLDALLALVADHPETTVYVGHEM